MKKIIYCIVLICIMAVLPACSSKTKQVPAATTTSTSVQSAAPAQPSGEVFAVADKQDPNNQLPGNTQPSSEAAVNTKTDRQENTEKSESVDQQPGTSTLDNISQIQPEKKDENRTGNKAVLPTKVYVFTNNSGCCEATKQYYAQHRDKVKEIESKYGSRVAFTWLDVGLGDVAYQKQLQQYASKFGVKGLPCIVVVDANDNVLINQSGSLNMPDIDKVFGGLN